MHNKSNKNFAQRRRMNERKKNRAHRAINGGSTLYCQMPVKEAVKWKREIVIKIRKRIAFA